MLSGRSGLCTTAHPSTSRAQAAHMHWRSQVLPTGWRRSCRDTVLMELTVRHSTMAKQQTSHSCCIGVSRLPIHPNRLLCCAKLRVVAQHSSSSQSVRGHRAPMAVPLVQETLLGIFSDTALGRLIWMLRLSCQTMSILTFHSLTHSIMCSLRPHGHMLQLSLRPIPKPGLNILSAPRPALGKVMRGCSRLACPRK